MRRAFKIPDALSKIARSALFCMLLVAMLVVLDFVMTPTVWTLNGWASSREVKGEVDVVALGSSRSYCTIQPMEMWRESGVTALDVTSAIQIIPVTTDYLEQVLTTQHPKLVMVELYMVGKRSTFDLYAAHKSLDYMPRGIPKLKGILTGAAPGHWYDLVVPLNLYHSRWSELTLEDFSPEKHSSYAYARGAYYLAEAKPLGEPLLDIATEEAYQRDLPYLRRMAELCAKQDVRLVLYTAPSQYRMFVEGAPLLDRLRSDLGAFANVDYLDLGSAAESAGLDPSTDYRDEGHLNHRGAVKISRWLADELVASYGLEDHREDALAAKWDADLAKYDEVFKADW